MNSYNIIECKQSCGSFASQVVLVLDVLDDAQHKELIRLDNELRKDGHPRFTSLFADYQDAFDGDEQHEPKKLVAVLKYISIGHAAIYDGICWKDGVLQKYIGMPDLIEDLKTRSKVDLKLNVVKNSLNYPTLYIEELSL